VLTEHTYEDRLSYIMECVFKSTPTSKLPFVTVLARVSDDKDLEKIVSSYCRQSLEDKSLVIVLDENFIPNKNHLPPDTRVFTKSQAENIVLGKLLNDCFVATLIAEDYYGEN